MTIFYCLDKITINIDIIIMNIGIIGKNIGILCIYIYVF